MLIKHFISAYKGSKLWKKLEKNTSADLYLLMPKSDEEYNYYAMLYLNKYIELKKAEKILILTHDEGVKKSIQLFKPEKNVEILGFSRRQALNLIKYYALYEFSTKLTIISLKEPYDTCGENLLGVKGVTKEELLCFDIYRFNEVPKVKPPVYNGDDKDIIDFMREQV